MFCSVDIFRLIFFIFAEFLSFMGHKFYNFSIYFVIMSTSCIKLEITLRLDFLSLEEFDLIIRN